MKQCVSVVIPFLNESANVVRLINTLKEFASIHGHFDLEVIFVNDGSQDDSAYLLKHSAHENYKARLISLSKNFGSHAALRAGILHASGHYITFMYADLQDPISLVNDLYKKCKKGVEIVWAVRNQTENGIAERTFSKLYSGLMRKYAISSYPQQGFDIVMFSSKIKNILNESIEANSSVFLQILSLGYRQDTIGYDKGVRKFGKSKWTFSKKIKLFIDSFVSFSYAPVRMVSVMGFIIFLVGVLWSAYILFRKFVYNDLESGWPTIICILLLGFGITNMSIGILAEYIWRTLDASRRRPVFLIDEVKDLN
jgi:glycosyltransferase involved in cell wall biosynthesis